MAKKLIINIGRQFGGGGRRVARMLSEKLGIPAYDNELLSKAAEESGFSASLFKRNDEKKRILHLGSLFGSNRYGTFTDNILSETELFKMQSDTIRKIAESGSAIFVGRASDYILRDMDCIDVFLSAPLEWRRDFVAQREGITAEEAEAKIARKDKGRAEYYNYFTFSNWGEASNYDLCIDSSVLGIEGTADFIIEYARRKGYLE